MKLSHFNAHVVCTIGLVQFIESGREKKILIVLTAAILAVAAAVAENRPSSSANPSWDYIISSFHPYIIIRIFEILIYWFFGFVSLFSIYQKHLFFASIRRCIVYKYMNNILSTATAFLPQHNAIPSWIISIYSLIYGLHLINTQSKQLRFITSFDHLKW